MCRRARRLLVRRCACVRCATHRGNDRLSQGERGPHFTIVGREVERRAVWRQERANDAKSSAAALSGAALCDVGRQRSGIDDFKANLFYAAGE